MKRLLLLLALLPGAPGPALASGPYSDSDALLSGKGAGMAAAAEHNGYPGPLHVLERADALALTPAQREQARRLYADMRREAVELGRAIVDAEAGLDELFRGRTATEAAVDEAAARIADVRGRLRALHLRQHLRMTALLTPAQIAVYYERPAAAAPAH